MRVILSEWILMLEKVTEIQSLLWKVSSLGKEAKSVVWTGSLLLKNYLFSVLSYEVINFCIII